MNIDTLKIFSLYGDKSPKQLALHDSSRGDNDLRLVYIVKFPNNEKLAIKVTPDVDKLLQ